MKAINNVTLRVVAALVLGLVLIVWPGTAMVYLVITIGVLFLLTGLFALVAYLARDKKRYPTARFPVDGAGCAIFGLLLMLMPEVFVGVLMYVLGALLLLAGVVQIASLVTARKWSAVPLGFYVVPVLVLLCGLVVLFNPFAVASTAFVVLGIASVVYGISELVNYYKFTKHIH